MTRDWSSDVCSSDLRVDKEYVSAEKTELKSPLIGQLGFQYFFIDT